MTTSKNKEDELQKEKEDDIKKCEKNGKRPQKNKSTKINLICCDTILHSPRYTHVRILSQHPPKNAGK